MIRLKIFDNFEELNISGLVETGGETIMLLSSKIGNMSNGVFRNISHTMAISFTLDYIQLQISLTALLHAGVPHTRQVMYKPFHILC